MAKTGSITKTKERICMKTSRTIGKMSVVRTNENEVYLPLNFIENTIMFSTSMIVSSGSVKGKQKLTSRGLIGW